MPDDSNGIYSVPAGTIVSTGDTILPSQHNPWANDSASAISARFSKDGRAPATGNWNINNFRLTNVGAPVASGDAVNKNYADGLNAVFSSKGHIFGLTLSNNVTDPTNDIDVAVGEAASDGAIPYFMALAAPITKRLDASWAVGSGDGGLDTGTIANGTYHLWLIQRSDTGVVDALFSTSATSPTMPTNYDRKAYLWPIVRSGGAIRPFKQNGNVFVLNSPVQERSSTSAIASTLFTLSAVPTGVVVHPLLAFAQAQNASGNIYTQVGMAGKTLSDGDIVTQTTLASDVAIGRSSIEVLTNTSGQVQFAVVVVGGSLSANTMTLLGWVYNRG